jgi:hypothetical protein
MKLLTLILSSIISINSYGLNYKVGDVILLDLDCFSCQRIEDETGSRFSHSGVVISNGRTLFVAQSLRNVHHLKLEDFLKMTPKYVVLRTKKNIQNFKMNHWEVYKEKFYKLPFDHHYLWDDKSLYCSEFIYKFMSSLINFSDLNTYPMDFTRNWEFWTRYFGQTPPQDMPGISPEDFIKSSDFRVIYDSVKSL